MVASGIRKCVIGSDGGLEESRAVLGAARRWQIRPDLHSAANLTESSGTAGRRVRREWGLRDGVLRRYPLGRTRGVGRLLSGQQRAFGTLRVNCYCCISTIIGLVDVFDPDDHGLGRLACQIAAEV